MLAGRVVLVQAEQGLGDSLQFLPCIPRLAAMCPRVDVDLQPELLALVRRHWPGRRIAALGDTPAADVAVRVPLLSLPLALELRDPGPVQPYLEADAGYVERWARELGARHAHGIAFAWRGNPAKRDDPQRSIPLDLLRPWLDATAARGCALVAVQRDVTDREREWLSQFAHVAVPGTMLRDFEDTAAVMALCRQVVSVDTSVAHLAGALGRPAVVLLRYASEWRWGIDRPDGATYRSVRVLRQPAPGGWHHVVRAMVAQLDHTT
jgi:hypothetical protein